MCMCMFVCECVHVCVCSHLISWILEPFLPMTQPISYRTTSCHSNTSKDYHSHANTEMDQSKRFKLTSLGIRICWVVVAGPAAV